MEKLFKTRGIGLIVMLMVTFAFFVFYGMAMANSTQDRSNQVIKMAATSVYVTGTQAGEMLLSRIATPMLRASAITIEIRKIDVTTSVYAAGNTGYNQNMFKRDLAGTATYEDAINKANTAIKRLNMSATSNLSEQRNFPLKIC